MKEGELHRRPEPDESRGKIIITLTLLKTPSTGMSGPSEWNATAKEILPKVD